MSVLKLEGPCIELKYGMLAAQVSRTHTKK